MRVKMGVEDRQVLVATSRADTSMPSGARDRRVWGMGVWISAETPCDRRAGHAFVAVGKEVEGGLDSTPCTQAHFEGDFVVLLAGNAKRLPINTVPASLLPCLYLHTSPVRPLLPRRPT